jgi:hypothetical protein
MVKDFPNMIKYIEVGHNIITKDFIIVKERGRRRIRTRGDVTREAKVGDRAISHGAQVASRSWKRQGNGVFPRASQNTSLPTHFRLLTCRTVR